MCEFYHFAGCCQLCCFYNRVFKPAVAIASDDGVLATAIVMVWGMLDDIKVVEAMV
ncbi:MAG: hypothetical protein RBJ76_14215 [Stenomitos frigidus ULC029]